MVVRMIEDEAVRLWSSLNGAGALHVANVERVDAIGIDWPQAPADDLHEQNFRARRARQRNAAHVPIDPGRQATDVADDLDLVRLELAADRVAFLARREGVDIGDRHMRRLELVVELLRVRPVDGEA